MAAMPLCRLARRAGATRQAHTRWLGFAGRPASYSTAEPASLGSARVMRPGTFKYMISPEFLTSEWALTRRITRSSTGVLVADCNGLAVIHVEGYDAEVGADTKMRRWMKYDERGEQVMVANPPHLVKPYSCAFEMTYIFRHSLLQDRLAIYFNRRRGTGPEPEDLFCDFDLESGELGVPMRSPEHVCGGDSYAGELTILSEDTWKLEYKVTGVSKDLTILSEYARLG
eukprot:TRINITY_DN15964_c0_g1_i2.p1 TRINITY_DN15964_c0_g1~~TRINITY_DN15964_c0_g1_i2.p1  ORF type:complete len:253 (+),score=4.72 TRINITY_DN15964_c0_g1_i2:76-759(+)